MDRSIHISGGRWLRLVASRRGAHERLVAAAGGGGRMTAGEAAVDIDEALGQVPKADAAAAPASDMWQDMRSRRRPGEANISPKVSGQISPALGIQAIAGKTSPLLSGTPKSAGGTPHSPPVQPRPNFSLGDFLQPKSPTIAPIAYAASSPSYIEAATAGATVGGAPVLQSVVAATRAVPPTEGPSQTLVDATDSAQTKPWMKPSDSPISMKDILAETKAPKRRGPAIDDPTNEKTRCSWGLEAMPEVMKQNANALSIEEAQEQEKKEQAQQKEAEELREFEAMFEALQIAERAEQLEAQGDDGKEHPYELLSFIMGCLAPTLLYTALSSLQFVFALMIQTPIHDRQIGIMAINEHEWRFPSDLVTINGHQLTINVTLENA